MVASDVDDKLRVFTMPQPVRIQTDDVHLQWNFRWVSRQTAQCVMLW